MNASVGDNDEGFLDEVSCQRPPTKANSRHNGVVRSKLLLRAGDVVLIKAALTEREIYFLGQLTQDVKEERREVKVGGGGGGGRRRKGGKGKSNIKAKVVLKKVIVPEKPTLRWFEADGSTNEGDLLYKYDREGSVSFEAVYESVSYSNAVFQKENGSSASSAARGGVASSVSRLQEFSITEEQHTHFRELVNVTSAERLLADTCGYRCRDGDSDGSSTANIDSEESEDADSDSESEEIPIRTTRSLRQVRPNVRHLPMRSAAHVLTSKKRKLGAAGASEEKEKQEDEVPSTAGDSRKGRHTKGR
jgi:hypothetical protein